MMRTILFLVLIWGLAACDVFNGNRNHLHHTQHLVFGTVVDVTYFGEDDARIAEAEKIVVDDFQYMHRAWHPYEAGPLARINALLPLGKEFSVAPSVLPLIKEGKRLEKLSDGFFNPAIGNLIKLWGFNREEDLPKNVPPDKKEIKAFLANRPSMQDIQLDGIKIKGNNPQLFLDFGGFAKGYAVDRVVEALKKKGFNNLIVNAGGDLRAIGSKDGKPWVIGIRHPRSSGVIASIKVQGDESVFTSGDYERYFEYKGKRYHHILNPKTGYPATDFQSVTILNKDAALADAAATALFVAGNEDWPATAKHMGITQVMIVDQQSRVLLTPAMKKRIKLQAVDEKDIVVVDLGILE